MNTQREAQHGTRRSAGMTLTELMIVVAMLAILAAILVPMFGSTSDMARVEAMASNAAQIRSEVIHHTGARDVPVSNEGYPLALSGGWFKGNRLPDHAWTTAPLIVETVNAQPNVMYPAVKTFDPNAAGAFNAWYNTSNGRFWVRVPSTASSPLYLFNAVNKCSVKGLNQTSD